MKVKSLVIIILCVLLLCSCSIFTGVEQTPPPSISPSPESNPTATPDYTEDWTNAKKLVWVTDGVDTLGVDPQIFIDFNNMLLEKGADFIVEFVDIDSFDYMEYQTYIRGIKAEGRQVDILNTGIGAEQGEGFATFPEAVKDGLLEPLDEYLSTVDGQELYKAFDPKAWESVKIQSKTYGVNNKINLVTPYYLHINKDVRDKYGILLPEEIDSLVQLEDALKLIAEDQKSVDKDKSIIPIDNFMPKLCGILGYVCLDSGVAVRYDDKGNPQAFNLFEDAEFISYMEIAYDYIDKGLMRIDESAFNTLSKGLFFATIAQSSPEEFFDGVLALDDQIEVVSYILSDGYVINELNRKIGIASWSENKEEAFKLLTMINTDSDLSNLLQYGIFGKHYELIDGKVRMLDTDKRAPGYFSPANQMITYPSGLETENKEQIYRDIHSLGKMSPIAGFTLDESSISEKLENIKEVYKKYEPIYTGEMDNIRETLNQANRELIEADVELVLREINQQLTCWWQD